MLNRAPYAIVRWTHVPTNTTAKADGMLACRNQSKGLRWAQDMAHKHLIAKLCRPEVTPIRRTYRMNPAWGEPHIEQDGVKLAIGREAVAAVLGGKISGAKGHSMSTKIYTGFRFRDRSWTAAHQHVMDFRLELGTLVHAMDVERVAHRAVDILDRRTLSLDKASEESPYLTAEFELMTEDKKDRLTFDLSLFPYGGRIYGITFGLPQHESLWLKKPFIEPWGYWNNTDRPEDVSAREWGVRRRTWDKILPGYASPAMSGFSAKCVAKYRDPVRIGEVMKCLPSLAKRVRARAVDRLAVEREVTLSNYYAFTKWLREPEGRQRLVEVGKEIKPKLAPRITKQMLDWR